MLPRGNQRGATSRGASYAGLAMNRRLAPTAHVGSVAHRIGSAVVTSPVVVAVLLPRAPARARQASSSVVKSASGGARPSRFLLPSLSVQARWRSRVPLAPAGGGHTSSFRRVLREMRRNMGPGPG